MCVLLTLALAVAVSAHPRPLPHRRGAVVPPALSAANTAATKAPSPQSVLASAFGPTDPQQIHLATVSDDVTRSVSWVTMADTPDSVVQFGTAPDALTLAAQGRSFAFKDDGLQQRVIYIHNALLAEALTPATRYWYRVGSMALNDWSAVYNFTTFDADYPLIDALVYGDFGVVNDQSQVYLAAEIAKHTPQQMIVHVGDFGYDLHDDNGQRGDTFMNQIQPLAAYVPYMTCLGNHETAYNFSHYTNRFSLISDTSNTRQNWWYSWDMSFVHFVAFSSEIYYLQPWANDAIVAQYEWLEKDLSSVDRTKTPWIVLYGHRPLYCSNVDDLPDCTTDAQTIRDGTVIEGVNYGLDALFYRYGVDLFLTAHEHSYERSLPVYNYQVDFQPNPNVYVDAKYTTHILTGAAGCQEYLDYYSNVTWGNWSQVRSSTYGYGHLRMANATHLHWTQELNETRDTPDDLWFVKTQARVHRPPRGELNAPRPLPAEDWALPHPNDHNGPAQGRCDRYCFGVCQRYHPLLECAHKCRCARHNDDAGGLERLAKESAHPVSVEKSPRR